MSITNQPIIALPPHHPTTTTPLHHHHLLLSAVTSAATLSHHKQIHAQILRTGLDHSISALTKLAISSDLDYALNVFDQIPKPNIQLSNHLLRELSRGHEPEKTLVLYKKIRRRDVGIDRFSFPPILKAITRVRGLEYGVEIHGIASKLGFDSDPFVQTGLVRMYAACGKIYEARLVFDKMSQRDAVAWSAMIDGYCQSGLYDDAVLLYEDMKRSNVEPDNMILCSVLSACGRAGNLSYGKYIHELITKNKTIPNTHLQTALVNMYANCGSMDLAQQVLDTMSQNNLAAFTSMVSGYSKLGQIDAARSIFDRMVEKDLVCWSAMISGYAESDSPNEALKLFKKMQNLGIKPDQVTMLSVISSCAHLGSLDQAVTIHTFVKNNRFIRVLSINNALIDMYAKCGSLEKAKSIFDKMPRKNVISWTTMINAFAIHGDAYNALQFFNKMKNENIEPNGVTFVGVLYACSHAGFVEEGRKIFSSMINEHKISPKHEHYGCMVDLFGRANLLEEAVQFIKAMPIAPNVVVWGALMAACRVHGETELGEIASKRVLDLEPDHNGAHVVLSNIYAKEKRWEEASQVRKSMKLNGIVKERGYSRIGLENEIHEFLTADKSHNRTDEIYGKLNEVVDDLKLVGYTPNTCNVLLNLEEEEKEEVVLWHSEKLALCLGLISKEKGSCIHIVKNLRICEDCHTFMKLVSKVYAKEIVVRDRSRFHRYKDGMCSCKDYW